MAETNLKKNKAGYGYKYTDLAQIHEYLESNGMSYYQYIQTIGENDFVMTVPIIEGKELEARRGCRVVQATLSGKSNPAQEQGSALTYARRYSLLMAFGLATEDDDAAALTVKKNKFDQSEADKDTTKTEAVKALTITKAKVDSIVNKALADGVDIVKICKLYNVIQLKELTEEQFRDICNNWTKKIMVECK